MGISRLRAGGDEGDECQLKACIAHGAWSIEYGAREEAGSMKVIPVKTGIQYRASRIHHHSLVRNIPASRFYVLQLLANSFQAFFPNQSPAQTVFPLQEKRIVTNFQSYDVNLSGGLISKSVPYFRQDTASFLGPLGDCNGLRLKISQRNPALSVLLFSPDHRGRV